MDPNEILRLVDTIHRDKNIDKEVVFEGIEAALVSAAKKHYGEDEEIEIEIDRQDGSISGTHNGTPLSPDEMSERIGAQTAKQVMIQKIREAERDTLFDEYEEMRGQLVTGVIQRYDNGTGTVALPNTEAILPRGEQIPGETHHVNERVRAVVYEVRKQGSRVRVILSRTKPQLVQRLFEQEIPEIAESVIEIRAMAREPGYRSKVAVSSTDQRIDCVGACVGVRGNRIKNIVDELAGERIDIVRYSDDMQVLIPNALQPAEVEEVILCQMLGRAIVLVREDQLSLAIGKRGQNVRLASKLCGWDIEIMTREELDDQIEQAVVGFSELDGVDEELAERLVGEGFLSYDDLSIIETDALMEMGIETEEQVEAIRGQAEVKAEEAERAAEQQRRQQREQERRDAAEAEARARAEAQAQTEAVGDSDTAESQSDAGDAVDAEAGPVDAEPSDPSSEAAAEPPASVPVEQESDEAGELPSVSDPAAETDERDTGVEETVTHDGPREPDAPAGEVGEPSPDTGTGDETDDPERSTVSSRETESAE